MPIITRSMAKQNTRKNKQTVGEKLIEESYADPYVRQIEEALAENVSPVSISDNDENKNLELLFPMNDMMADSGFLDKLSSRHTPTNTSKSITSSSESLQALKNKIAQQHYKTLGKGGFGIVFGPALPNLIDNKVEEYPTNVTKLFYEKEPYNYIIKLKDELPKLMGPNSGHRINAYKQKYTKHNLPYEIQIQLDKAKDFDIYPVHMPDLGYPISDIHKFYHSLRGIPIPHTLNQVVKLLTQTAKLYENNYTHGDIRDTNVMINPKTGDLTIIDFDWLRPTKDFRDKYHFNFYNNPPETLFRFPIVLIKEIARHREYVYGLSPPPSYMVDYIRTLHLFTRYNMNVYSETDTFNSKIDQVVDGLVDTVIHFNNNPYLVMDKAMPTFDNFGLAYTLLKLFKFIYPGSTIINFNKESELEVFKKSLEKRSNNNGVPYTPEEIHNYSLAILQITRLLKYMYSFQLRDRPNPNSVLSIAKKFMSNNNVPLIGDDAGSGAGSGASSRRRTRRNGLKRKHRN